MMMDGINEEWTGMVADLSSEFTILQDFTSSKTSRVFLALHKETKEKCIIKVVLNSYEISVHEKLQEKGIHSNIVELLSSWLSNRGDYGYMVIEYVPGMDLFEYLGTFKALEESHAKLMFKQIAEGLEHIHKANFCHLDISLENILIDQVSGIPVICDFGFARGSEQKFSADTKDFIVAKPRYAAPELLLRHRSIDGKTADMYSLGVVLFAMLFGHFPYNSLLDDKLVGQAILDGNFPDFVNLFASDVKLSDEAKDLLCGLLCNQEKRLTISEVLAHPWLNAGKRMKQVVHT